jgi:ribosomal protein S18 acetylase RimI-like enzyme
MRSAFDIEPVDHSVLATAQQLHAVQMSAYAQEASLLGATYFPPLERSVSDVLTSAEVFLAAFIGDEMVGAVSVWPDREVAGINTASLVVAPQFQRRGIGTGLLAKVLAEHKCEELTVQTGARNVPALALYKKAGFVELRRWLVGREPLELVKLHRPPSTRTCRPSL